METEARKARKSECNHLRYLRDTKRIKAQARQYRLENPEKIKERKRQDYLKNAERIEERSKKWIAENPERYREYKKQWEAENYEKVKTYKCSYSKTHPEQRRQDSHIRRTRKQNGVCEKINSLEIYERDKWICQLCHEKVDKKLRWPNPMSSSLDHIIALVLGGSHIKNNVQLAHLRCNVKAGIRGVKQLRMPLMATDRR